MFAEQVIAGYLELLVNSRNELALARVINVPDRKLDHAAFTDIRHEAELRNMSMYQVGCANLSMEFLSRLQRNFILIN